MVLLGVLAASLLVFTSGSMLLGAPPLVSASSAAACVLAGLLAARWSTIWAALREEGLRCGEAVDALATPGPALRVGLAAAASLVAELILIRWHGSTFQVFSYFKNVSLLAAFLGLGIGYATAARPLLLGLALPLLAAQIVGLRLLGLTTLHRYLQSPVTEQAGLGLVGADEQRIGHWLLTYGLLIAVFLVTLLTCVPLGQLAGRTLRALDPVRAYGWNLVGSLFAVGLFALLSLGWTPPLVWLGCLVLLLVPFLAVLPRASLVASLSSVALACVALAVPTGVAAIDYYSPYQVVTLRLDGRFAVIEASRSYFQQVWNLRAGHGLPGVEAVSAYYDLPYTFKPAPARVMVVGAGAGNDVAAALRGGAGHVDAVEIDPLILSLGHAIHPERPYADPRVDAIVQDARAWVKRTPHRYDVIVYGLLDSHTVLGGSSSVRLDSYVYTVEALREARARLTDDGVLVMSFTLLSREIAWKLFLMLREAFGSDPRAFETVYDGGITFVAGPGLAKAAPVVPFPEVTASMRASGVQADVSTDDWPFLYMARRRYPVSYLLMAGCLLALAVVAVRGTVGASALRFSPTAFLLGAGFMLLETKAITELALVYGSSWQVTSAVIAGVLVMALLANAWVSHRGAPSAAVYVLVLAAVALSFAAPRTGLDLSPAAERVLATGLATLPLFFSGLAFSGEMRRRGDAPALMASNLLGAMVGGLLEYNSMYTGTRALAWLAAAIYGAAALAALRARPSDHALVEH